MARQRILLVEPMAWLRDVEEEILINAGFHPCLAGALGEALERANVHHPHAVVSRYLLPDGTGVVLFHDLRKRGIYAPFIGLAGRAQHAEDFAEAGVRHIVTLPFHVTDLLTTIRKALDPTSTEGGSPG